MEQDPAPAPRRPVTTVDRRTMLKVGAAASAGAWAAPSILTLDRVAAAAGSCLTKTRKVDFSRFAGSQLPSSFLSDDGTVTVTFSMSDPDNVQEPGYKGVAWTTTLNGRDNPVITAMEGARFGDYVDLVFQFSVPVAPTFHLVDVDRSTFSWEDTVRVIGRNGATVINPAAMNVGGAQTQINANTVRGISSTSSADGNVEVVFDEGITRLEIRHQDTSSWTAFQWIGVHDFYWC